MVLPKLPTSYLGPLFNAFEEEIRMRWLHTFSDADSTSRSVHFWEGEGGISNIEKTIAELQNTPERIALVHSEETRNSQEFTITETADCP